MSATFLAERTRRPLAEDVALGYGAGKAYSKSMTQTWVWFLVIVIIVFVIMWIAQPNFILLRDEAGVPVEGQIDWAKFLVMWLAASIAIAFIILLISGNGDGCALF